MAKIAYGADVQNIRGKVGTNVFTNSRTGPCTESQAIINILWQNVKNHEYK